jgi:hypothetical protein
LGVDVVRIFDEATAVGAHIAELAVLADIDLVFADIPQILEPRFVNGFLQSGVFNVAVALGHGRAVFDVTFRIDADFAVEAGVVMLGFGKKGEVDNHIRSTSASTFIKRKPTGMILDFLFCFFNNNIISPRRMMVMNLTNAGIFFNKTPILGT